MIGNTGTGNTGKRHPVVGWVWGFMLILAGALFLALNMDLVSLEGSLTLPLIAGGVGALALPFLIAWLVNREHSWTLVPAWVFVSLAVILMIIWLELPYPQVVPVVILVQIAIPFLVTYLADRQNWWALIPVYAMLVLAALVALTALRTPEEMMGGIALIFVALPFWWIYMRNRSLWWALIPAGGLSAIALPLMFLSSQRLSGQEEFILFTALLAILFVIVWLTNRRLDWALWTAGGFVISIGLAVIRPEFRQNWPGVLLALGGYIVSRQLFGRRVKKAAQPPQAQPGASQGKAPSATVLPPSERPPEPAQPRPADDVEFRPLDIPSDEPPSKA